MFSSLFCTFIATGDWNEVSVVTLLTLFRTSSYSSSMNLMTASKIFPWTIIHSDDRYCRFLMVQHLCKVYFFWSASLSRNFLLRLNTLKMLKKFGTSYLISLFAYFCSLIVHSDFSSSVELYSSSSTEQL